MILSVEPKTPTVAKKVVVTEFIQDGGLGNQLTEWAAGYSIARTLNLGFRWVWKPSKLREFGLHHFGIGENPPESYTRLMFKAGQGNRALRERAIKLINVSNAEFCAISCPFQCESCFIDHADEIREIFRLEPLELEIPEGATPVAVQVRRGDYLTHSKLNVCTEDYYRNAMRFMRDAVTRPHFFMVSDDPEWCESVFGKYPCVTVMPPQSAIDGLRTMVACKAAIISNSTYGWWGAWLNESGPVVVPEIWHHKAGAYGDWNPVPDRWHRVSIKGDGLSVTPFYPSRELPKPELHRAIVIPYKADGARWEELRYTLRSIHRFLKDDVPIILLGTRKPGWLIPHPRITWKDAWTYDDALVRGCQMADEIAWWNDDITLLRDTTWADLKVPGYLRPVRSEFLNQMRDQGNPWQRGVLRVLEEMQMLGHEDLMITSTHMPYVYEREKTMALFRDFGTWAKMPLELAYFNLHREGLVELDGIRTQEAPFGDAQFLNYNDDKLTPAVRTALKELLPDFAPWELKYPFES